MHTTEWRYAALCRSFKKKVEFLHTNGQIWRMTKPDPFARSSLFEAAMKEVLRPLAKALIDQGVTAPAFYKIVKQAYVDAAVASLGDGATDSRTSIITGVHRRDVKALRSNTNPDNEVVRQKVSRLATIVGRWMSEPDYLDEQGDPKTLPRTAPEGASFDGLVQSVSKDIRPRTILDELIRQGLAVEDGGDITLSADALVGPADIGQQIHFFERNLADHLSAAVSNLSAEDPAFFERAAFYNALSDAAVDDIEAVARESGMGALRKVAAVAAEKQKQDTEDASATHRFRFGMYFYREDDGDGDVIPKRDTREVPDEDA